MAATGGGLPTYTVLIPLIHGSPSAVLRALAAASYPSGRLDAKLLSTAEPDPIVDAHLPMWVERIEVGEAAPALGSLFASGLARARGRYLAVYEPTDEPAPDLLRHAAITFDRLGPTFAVLWVEGRLHLRRYAAASVGGWDPLATDHDDLLRRLRRDGFGTATYR